MMIYTNAMKSFEVMRRLSAASSRVDREQIVFDAYMKSCYEFFIGCKLALDPLVCFGVSKVAEILEDDGAIGTFTFDDFLDLTTKLKSGMNANLAREAIFEAAEICQVATWNLFYRRILMKDMGIDAELINKILHKLIPSHADAEQYLIPIYKCQLARDGEQQQLHGRKLIDCGLNGLRVFSVLDKEANKVTMFTTTGIVESFPEIRQSLTRLMERLSGSLVLDGDLLAAQGLPTLKRPEMARYALFDVIPLTDFRVGYSPKSQRERRLVLEALQEHGLFEKLSVRVIPQIEIDLNSEHGRTALEEFKDQMSGFATMTVKDPDAPYEGKRTSSWLKFSLHK